MAWNTLTMNIILYVDIYIMHIHVHYILLLIIMQFFGNNGGHVRIRVVKSSLHNELKHINI